MDKRDLPIGSVVRTKKNKLAIITGYGSYSLAFSDYQGGSSFYDYNVSPYPFDCLNVKNNFKLYKKFEWFDFKLNGLNNNDIESVIFMGYSDQEYEEMLKKLND